MAKLAGQISAWGLDPHRLILILLVGDALAFLFRGEINDGVDCLAWILLMVLYGFESRGHVADPAFLKLIRALRVLIFLIIIAAEFSYLVEEAWLDGVYALEWWLVIALFEFEARFPLRVSRHLGWFRSFGMLILLSMLAVFMIWLARGDWFNALDAMLWSLAFVLIDLELMRGLRTEN